MRALRIFWSRLLRVLAIARCLLQSPKRFARDARRYLNRIARETPAEGSLPNVVPLNLRICPELADKPTINVLIPGMSIRFLSGGPNTAIQLAHRLAQSGLRVRYLSTDVPCEPDTAKLWEHIASLTGISDRFEHVSFVSADNRSNPVDIGANDVFFATAWWTAQMVKRALPLTGPQRFLYLIQEFEPALYAWSSRYALAEETYRLDFHPVVNQRALLEYFQQHDVGRFADPDFSRRSLVFEPSVDRRKFHPSAKHRTGKRRLLFYARPDAPRNLFELGIAALRCAVAAGTFPADQWELRYIGDSLPAEYLGSGQTIESVGWLSYDDYAALLGESDLGLSLMLSPHTSYPPLEMAACGMQVVTNVFSVKNEQYLESLSENLIPVQPDVESITTGLMEAARQANGPDQPQQKYSIDSGTSIYDELVPRLLELIDDCRQTESVSHTPLESHSPSGAGNVRIGL